MDKGFTESICLHNLHYEAAPKAGRQVKILRPWGQTFFVSEGQPQSDSVLRLRDSVYHKVGPRFEMLSY